MAAAFGSDSIYPIECSCNHQLSLYVIGCCRPWAAEGYYHNRASYTNYHLKNDVSSFVNTEPVHDFLDFKPDLNISVGGLLFAVEEGASHFDQGQML
jgi:hypothetical protein